MRKTKKAQFINTLRHWLIMGEKRKTQKISRKMMMLQTLKVINGKSKLTPKILKNLDEVDQLLEKHNLEN